MENARRPHFLEVFLPNLSSERLKIPSNFIKFLAGRTSGSVSLTGPSGNSWHVNLIEHNGHLFFDDGWPSFVKDHSIECGDSIVFGYDGNLDFTVLVFDQTSCEKEETFYAKCSEELSGLDRNFGKKRECEEEATFSGVLGEKRMKEGWVPLHLDLKARNEEDELKTSSCKSHELENVKCLVEASKRPVVLGLSAVANGQMMPTVRNIPKRKNMPILQKSSSKKKKTASEKKTNISKFIEEKAAQYFSSSFPYFVRVMKYSNVNERSVLKIPVHFSMAHFPNCRIKVTVRNLSGGYWMLNAVPTARKHSTMHTFCGGWLAFVRGNRIKEEDVCIFELVDKFEMRVHILRLGLEGVDNKTHKSGIDACGVGSAESPLKIVEYVEHDNEVRHQNTSEITKELIIYNDKGHKKASDMITESHPEASSFSHNCDDAIVLTSPITIDPNPISRTQSKSSDQLVGCDAEGATSYQTGRKSQADSRARCTTQMPVTAEGAGAPMLFTSPFPNFMKVMMCSNVGGSYTLAVPRKFSAAYLPSYRTEIVLRNMEGGCWNVISGRYGLQTKFCGGWMSFVRQNRVKLGDICVFELVDERVLQVRIFQASQGVQKFPSSDAVDDYSNCFC